MIKLFAPHYSGDQNPKRRGTAPCTPQEVENIQQMIDTTVGWYRQEGQPLVSTPVMHRLARLRLRRCGGWYTKKLIIRVETKSLWELPGSQCPIRSYRLSPDGELFVDRKSYEEMPDVYESLHPLDSAGVDRGVFHSEVIPALQNMIHAMRASRPLVSTVVGTSL